MERRTSKGYFETKKRMKKIASRTRTRGVEWLTLTGTQKTDYQQHT